MCPYVKVTGYHDNPKCTKKNTVCPMMRRCTERMVWLPLNSMDGCKLKEETIMPKGAHKVRFKKNGLLYVEYNDAVVMLPYDGEDTPEYVFLTNRGGKLKIKKGDNAK